MLCCDQTYHFRNRNVQLPKGAKFVIANSLAESNKAAGSEFNHRVVECRLAAVLMAKLLGLPDWSELKRLKDVQSVAKKSFPEMIALVDQHLHSKPFSKSEISDLLQVTEENLNEKYLTKNTKDLDQFKLHQRATHVFSEAFRVNEYQRICQNSQNNSLEELGQLMYDSHWSCALSYECSHPKLDQLVKLSKEWGAFGARLTGAGWGGCIVALVAESKVEDYISYVQTNYYRDQPAAEGLQPDTYLFPTEPGQGAGVFSHSDLQ